MTRPACAPPPVASPTAPRRQLARRTPLSVGRPALAVAAAASAAVVLGLWWTTTPGIATAADVLINAGRITGLLGTWAILAIITLMARLPPLERTFGADRLARWHALGGRYAITLLIGHALLIIWGYALAAHVNPVAQAGTLLTSYPDMLLATAGFGLFVVVAVISARAARARVSYETWYHVHLLTYLAVALSFLHQLSNGDQFVTNAAARAFWIASYLAVFLPLAWYRLAVPLRTALRHRVEVAAVLPEGPGVVSVVLHGRDLDRLGATSGQFFRLRFLTRTGWYQSHPYSLSAPPQDQLLRFTVKSMGGPPAEPPEGTKVWLEGPYGAVTERLRTRPHVLLVAAGIGISPLRALFETLPADPGELTLVYRARDPSDLVLWGELEGIAARRGARLVPVLGTRHQAPTGQWLRSVTHLRDSDVYVCGPESFLADVDRELRGAGVPAARIHVESFAL